MVPITGAHQTLLGKVENLKYEPKAPSTYWGKIAQGPIQMVSIWDITWVLKCINMHR